MSFICKFIQSLLTKLCKSKRPLGATVGADDPCSKGGVDQRRILFDGTDDFIRAYTKLLAIGATIKTFDQVGDPANYEQKLAMVANPVLNSVRNCGQKNCGPTGGIGGMFAGALADGVNILADMSTILDSGKDRTRLGSNTFDDVVSQFVTASKAFPKDKLSQNCFNAISGSDSRSPFALTALTTTFPGFSASSFYYDDFINGANPALYQLMINTNYGISTDQFNLAQEVANCQLKILNMGPGSAPPQAYLNPQPFLDAANAGGYRLGQYMSSLGEYTEECGACLPTSQDQDLQNALNTIKTTYVDTSQKASQIDFSVFADVKSAVESLRMYNEQALNSGYISQADHDAAISQFDDFEQKYSTAASGNPIAIGELFIAMGHVVIATQPIKTPKSTTANQITSPSDGACQTGQRNQIIEKVTPFLTTLIPLYQYELNRQVYGQINQTIDDQSGSLSTAASNLLGLIGSNGCQVNDPCLYAPQPIDYECTACCAPHDGSRGPQCTWNLYPDFNNIVGQIGANRAVFASDPPTFDVAYDDLKSNFASAVTDLSSALGDSPACLEAIYNTDVQYADKIYNCVKQKLVPSSSSQSYDWNTIETVLSDIIPAMINIGDFADGRYDDVQQIATAQISLIFSGLLGLNNLYTTNASGFLNQVKQASDNALNSYNEWSDNCGGCTAPIDCPTCQPPLKGARIFPTVEAMIGPVLGDNGTIVQNVLNPINQYTQAYTSLFHDDGPIGQCVNKLNTLAQNVHDCHFITDDQYTTIQNLYNDFITARNQLVSSSTIPDARAAAVAALKFMVALNVVKVIGT
ncbi:MAG: hypothetical protein S4CHLAM102_14670 [Chlamydiia bacterium]|nr:hypothetical protein [Chlamydiia bacterium]